jgi:hypothetical protein
VDGTAQLVGEQVTFSAADLLVANNQDASTLANYNRPIPTCSADQLVWCAAELGCTVPEACNYNTSALACNPDRNDCVFATATCELCSGAQDGSGFVMNGDEDGDNVCDVIDANRRVPLSLVNYSGVGTFGDVVIDANYSDALATTADLTWSFKIPGRSQLDRVVYENFSSVQFGQEFNMTVTDPGRFELIMAIDTMQAGLPPGITVRDTSVYQIRDIFGFNNTIDDAALMPTGTDVDWLNNSAQGTESNTQKKTQDKTKTMKKDKNSMKKTKAPKKNQITATEP